MLLYQILASTLYGKIYKCHTKTNLSWSVLNGKFELPDVSCSVSEIQNYEFIIKKHDTFTDNPTIIIYVNKIENKITFRIKHNLGPKIIQDKLTKFMKMF